MNKKKESIFILAFLLLPFFFLSGIMYLGFNWFYNQYEDISYSNDYKAKVQDKVVLYGYSYLTFSNGFKLSVPISINRNYNPESFADIIQENDEIYKAANTDSLYVIKANGKKYLFVFDRIITIDNRVIW